MNVPFAVGYCTNVHAGADWSQTQSQLQRYAVPVRNALGVENLPLGLWLSAAAARESLDGPLGDHGIHGTAPTAPLAAWLRERGLSACTMNGFPYGDFHQPVVKHDVYLPTWLTAERQQYTLDLFDILHALLPEGAEGTISTLPLAWGTPGWNDEQYRLAARRLRQVAARLSEMHHATGRRMSLCLEPEPGCLLQTGADVIRFFENYLLPPPQGPAPEVGDACPPLRDDRDLSTDELRDYLRVCHDICHADVMFEDQAELLSAYRSAGLRLGKVQVSSAVGIDFDALPADQRQAALNQLAAFHEPRYLHQTVVRQSSGETAFFEDLPLALAAAGANFDPRKAARQRWRTHFHVPVYLDAIGLLRTSQPEIRQCVAEVLRHGDTRTFEVETYAWGVLPPELQMDELSQGIARELAWFDDLLNKLTSAAAD